MPQALSETLNWPAGDVETALDVFESRMSQRGQATIPAAIRACLDLNPGERVRFAIRGDDVVIERAESRLLAGYGAVQPRNRPEDWDAIEEDFERQMAADAADDG